MANPGQRASGKSWFNEGLPLDDPPYPPREELHDRVNLFDATFLAVGGGCEMGSALRRNLTLIASNEICIDPSWDLESNVVLAIIHREGAEMTGDGILPALRKRLSFFNRRFSNLKTLLKGENDRKLSPEFDVCLACPNTDVFPLFATAPDGSGTILADPEAVVEDHPGQTSFCPVMMLNDEIGVAAFLILARHLLDKDFYSLFTTAIAQLYYRGFILSEASVDFSFGVMAYDYDVRSSEKFFEKIFASYACEDRCIVEFVESVVNALGLGELRWDVRILRAGDKWQDAIEREINAADSFQLFWSEHASSLENVRKEWMYALDLKRDRFIKPVYWIDPLADPPDELKDIHFAKIKVLP